MFTKFLALLLFLIGAQPSFALVVNGQLVKAQAENQSSEPTAASGRFYFDTISLSFKWYDTGAWRVGVDTDSTQTLYAKTLGTPTLVTALVEDYIDIKEESAPSTPSAGKVRVYAKSDKKLYTKNSDGTESAIGSGAGEKNYIAGSSTATGWTCVGDLDVVTTTTAAELPRENTTASGIKITADANTQSVADYCYHDFTLDDVDLAKKLKLQWAQKTTGAYVASALAAVITTQADRTTALITPSTTNIPASDIVFPSSFDSTTTATLSLVIRATTDMATDDGIVISDVVVGPGVVTPGYAGYGPITWTPTGTWSTNTTYTGVYYRDGSKLSGRIVMSTSGSPDSGALTINLPTGLTIDSSAFTGNTSYTVGHGWAVDASTSNRTMLTVTIHPTSTGLMTPRVATQSANTAVIIDRIDTNVSSSGGAPFTFVSGDSVVLTFENIPIAEWSTSTSNYINDSVIYSNARMQYTTNAASSYNTGDVVKYEDLVFDTPVAKYGTSTGLYTVPRDGVYQVTAAAQIATTLTATATLRIYKNSTFMHQGTSVASGANQQLIVSGLVSASAGDTIDIRLIESNSGTVTLTTDAQTNTLNIHALANYTAGDAVGFGRASLSASGLVYGTSYIYNQDATGLSDNTITDMGSSTIAIPSAGTYLLEYGCQPSISTSVDPTSISATLSVTDTSNNSITSFDSSVSKITANTYRVTMSHVWEYTASGAITLKLRGSVTSSGGTITTRNMRDGWLKVTKIN